MKFAVLFVGLTFAGVAPAPTFAAPRHSPAGRSAVHPGGREVKHLDSLHLRVARAVFPRERWEKLVSDASLELTQRLTQASQGHFQLDPNFADRLREEYERLAPYEELVGYQARILGREYKPAELRQLLAFYQSPLGKKSVLLIHDLTAYSSLQMQQKVHAGIGDALTRLKPFVHPLPDGDGDGDASGDAPTMPDLSATGVEPKEL